MGPLGHSLAALAAVGAAPVVAGALVVRPELRHGIGERLGRLPRVAPVDVWLHGASVGEAIAVGRLAGRLRASGRRTFASAITATGRAVSRER